MELGLEICIESEHIVVCTQICAAKSSSAWSSEPQTERALTCDVLAFASLLEDAVFLGTQ